MNGYGLLSRFYDRLSDDDYYARYAAFIHAIFQAEGVSGLVLDAGCGTGRMTELLSRYGYEMIGVDASEEMLAVAAAKTAGILWLRQKLEKLDLFGTVRGAASTLDTVNHMSPAEVSAFFSRVSLFMESGGVFLFDINLPYKHHRILSGNAFIREWEDGLLVWRNWRRASPDRVEICLDFFLKEEGGVYRRSEESFFEYTYSPDEIRRLLEKSAFDLLSVTDGETFSETTPKSQRMLFVAKRKERA